MLDFIIYSYIFMVVLFSCNQLLLSSFIAEIWTGRVCSVTQTNTYFKDKPQLNQLSADNNPKSKNQLPSLCGTYFSRFYAT